MKVRVLAFLLGVLGLSACSGGGGGAPSVPNNPSSILVTATVQGVATSGISITMSTALSGENGNVPAGTIVGTETTDSTGTVTFNSGVPTTGKLCLSATYTVGTQSQTLAGCHSQPYPSTATINFTI